MPAGWIRGTARNGTIVMDEPVDLPDGTEVELYLDEGQMGEQELMMIAAGKREAAQRGENVNENAVWGFYRIVSRPE